MSTIRDHVMGREVFCHHDHHRDFIEFDEGRTGYDFRSLLSYATADLAVAEGPRPPAGPMDRDRLQAAWAAVRATGYGRAVTLGCRELFGIEYGPETWDEVTAKLQDAIRGRTAAEAYDWLVRVRAQNGRTVQDGAFRLTNPRPLRTDLYPPGYSFAFRIDPLLSPVDDEPIRSLEEFTGTSILTLERLTAAFNAAVDRFLATGRLAAFKIGMAYQRDLAVSMPTRHEAESAFTRLRFAKEFRGGIQQNSGAVDASSGRALGDWMFHRLMERAHDEDLPVQVHTGYLAGTWGSLAGSRAALLIPVFERYRRVRFDVFHASWPWASEMGAIAKNCPNVWADMCWAWAMNPAAAARTLSDWIDCVPYNKIFAYGADSGLPWHNMGYTLQAKEGVARVLEEKISTGCIGPSTAEEIADAILWGNGAGFYGPHAAKGKTNDG